jgi:lysophospholipase L1-like esterase
MLGAALLLPPGEAGAQVKKVYCMGASICRGVGATKPYSTRLAVHLGSGYEVKNGGYSGTTLLRKGNSPWWPHLPELFAYKPGIVTLELGGNDTKPGNWKYGSEFGADLRAMVDTLRSLNPDPQIFVCLPVPAFLPPGSIDGQIILKEIIPVMRNTAPEIGIGIIDLNTPLLGMGSHFPDGVHPDDIVHDSISRIMYRALRQTTAISPLFRPSRTAGSTRILPLQGGVAMPWGAGPWRDFQGRYLPPKTPILPDRLP